MLGMNQEELSNFNTNRQLFLLSSLYGYTGHTKQVGPNTYTFDTEGFRDLMENAELPVNPEKVTIMSPQRERQLRSQGNDDFLIETLKRAGELGLLDKSGHQQSPVVQRLQERLREQQGLMAYRIYK